MKDLFKNKQASLEDVFAKMAAFENEPEEAPVHIREIIYKKTNNLDEKDNLEEEKLNLIEIHHVKTIDYLSSFGFEDDTIDEDYKAAELYMTWKKDLMLCPKGLRFEIEKIKEINQMLDEVKEGFEFLQSQFYKETLKTFTQSD